MRHYIFTKMCKGGLPLASLLFVMSGGAYAASLPPMLDFPSSQGTLFVPARGIDKNTMISVHEVEYPDSRRNILSSPSVKLKASIDTSKQGVLLSWDGTPSVKERYFEVSLTSPSTKSFQERISSLVVIPPKKFALKYDFSGRSFKNSSNGYVVVMENTECGKSVGRSWLVGPGRVMSIPALEHSSELLVGRGGLIKTIKSCER